MSGGDRLGFQNIFKRYELKYLITEEQYSKLRELMKEYMQGDKYGKSTICNLYYDTPDYLLIRRSREKPVFKEKLRVRSYKTASPDSIVFVELKKKYNIHTTPFTILLGEKLMFDGEMANNEMFVE